MKSNAFINRIAFSFSLLIVALPLEAAPICGNGAPSPTGPPCNAPGGKCPDENAHCEGKNKFSSFTGNAYRPVLDFKVDGSVGDLPLVWRRYGNSRFINGAENFGQAQNWTHEYDWNLRSGSAVNGQDRLIAYQPDGSTITFLRDPANANRFVPPANVGQVITVQSGIYTLQMADGARYQFNPFTDSSGTFYPGTWFQMSSFQDAKGNVTRSC